MYKKVRNLSTLCKTFFFLKLQSKHTHTHKQLRHTSAKDVCEDNRRVCFKIKHGLYLQGCFFFPLTWMHHPDVSLLGLQANTIACIIYSSIINKPWHPLWTYFFSQSDCQDLFFWRYCGATISQSSQRCAARGALKENDSFPSVSTNTHPKWSRSEPHLAEKGTAPKATPASSVLACHFCFPLYLNGYALSLVSFCCSVSLFQN